MKKFFKEQNIGKLNLISLLSIIVLISFCMGYFFISSYYDEFIAELKAIEQDYVRLEKERIKGVVTNEMHNYEIQDQHSSSRLQQDLVHKVYAAYKIMAVVYNTYQSSKSDEEIKEILKSAVQSIRLADELCYFFFDDNQTFIPLSKSITTPQARVLESLSSNAQKRAFRKFLNRIDSHWEGFIGVSSGQFVKISAAEPDAFVFVKRFEASKLFFGALGFLSNTKLRLQNSVIKTAENRKQTNQLTKLVSIFEIAEVNGTKKLKKILAIENNISKLEKRLLSHLEMNADGFFRYPVHIPNQNKEKLKMVYYRHFPQWNWVVTKGFYYDDLKKSHQDKIADLKIKTLEKVRTASIMLLIFIVLSIIISILFSRGIAKIFDDYKQKVEERNQELSDKNLLMLHEIKERKKVENTLRQSEDQLRVLSSEIQLTEERERRRIATDLHDSIGPMLAVSNLKLDMLSDKIDPPDIKEELGTVQGQIKEVIQQARSLTFQLSPPILYKLGLEAALASLAEQTQDQQGINTVFEADSLPKELDQDVQIHLFRSVRELVINVLKYARAKNVKIAVSRENNHIKIDVTDDGVGFEFTEFGLSRDGTGGLGLFSINERLRLLGGQMKINTSPGKGTSVILNAPLCQKNEHSDNYEH